VFNPFVSIGLILFLAKQEMDGPKGARSIHFITPVHVTLTIVLMFVYSRKVILIN